MSPDLVQRLQQRLSEHETQQLTRTRSISHVDALDFTRNDYLSLSQHPLMKKNLMLGASGSPVTYYTKAHEALEQHIANWLQYPRALVFTSGYLAILSALTALMGRDDFVAVDKQCHASVFDAIQLSKATWQRYADDDHERLESILQNQTKGSRFIMTSSVFSMQGHIADLNYLMHIAKKYDATLIIDDVHGTGILGPQGQGAVAHWHLNHEMPLVIGSLTKGLGTLGAFVAGNTVMIEAILQFARPYMFSTTLPSDLANQSITAINLAINAHHERSHLNTLIDYFQNKARAQGLNILPSTTPIQAIVFPDIDSMQHTSRSLLEKNILVNAIRPPTVPKNSPRIRITLNASHQLADLDCLFRNLP